MNYWRLDKKGQNTFRQRLSQILFKFIDVQSQQRNKLQCLIVLINYLMSYVILFVFIMQCLGRQLINTVQRTSINTIQQISINRLNLSQINYDNYKTITILLFTRMGLSIIYILFQKLPILIIIKSLIVVNLFMAEFQSNRQDFISIQIPLLIIQLLALSIWTFKIQRRIKHFDSRLNSILPLIKDSLIFITAFLIKRLQKMTFSATVLGQWSAQVNLTIYQIEVLQIIIVCLFGSLFLDFRQILYNKTFKTFIITLDLSFIALLVSMILSIQLTGRNIVFYNYLMLLGTLIGLQLILLFRKDDFKILFQLQATKLEFQSQNKLIQYFQTLRILIKTQNITNMQKNMTIIKYILYHRSVCLYPSCPFTKRYNVEDTLHFKCQLLEEYMLKSIQQLSKTRPQLKMYLIFYLSPKDKIFRYLDVKQSYMKRQLWRMKQTKKKLNNQIRILEAQIIKKNVTNMIEIYLTYGKRFFQILLKENVNSQNLIQYGIKMLDVLQQIQQMKENSINFTQGVRMLVNNFSSRLINDSRTQILQTVIDPPFLIHKTTQVGPTMIVSAQPQNFLYITDANVACTKQFYYPRQVFLKVTVIDLLPDQIKKLHYEHFQKVSKKMDFDGQKDFPTSLFVTNAHGFISFFIAKVYLLNSIKGRMWCVAVQITHKMDSIVLIAKQRNGVVMGISQMAVFHGFKKQDKGKQLTLDFYKKLTKKIQGTAKYQSVVVQAYERIFENSDFEFVHSKRFQVVQQYYAFEFSYYLVEIKQFIQTTSKGRSSIIKSVITLDNKNQTKILINQQELNFVPQTQMFFHSDGVVRFYQQKQKKLLARFQGLTEKSVADEDEVRGQLGEGITQMRLVDEELDFLQNIDQKQQFMSKPRSVIDQKQHKLNNFNLKIQFFEQSIKQRKTILPQWLKYTRIFMLIIFILLIIILTLNFNFNNTRTEIVDDFESVMNGLCQNQINYIKLGKNLLSAKYYNPFIAEKLKDLINNVNNQIQSTSQNIFGVDSTVQTYFSSSSIQKTISNYLIAFSGISNMGVINQSSLINFDQKTILKNLILKIVPSFNTLIDSKISSFQQDTKSNILNCFLLMLGVDIFLVIIMLWVYLTSKHIIKLKSNILTIMTRIKDVVFQRQLIKIQLFQQYLYFDKDIYCQQDIQYVLNTQQYKNNQSQINNGPLNNLQNGQTNNNLMNKKSLYKRKFSWKNKKAQKQAQVQNNLKQHTSSQHKILTTDNQLQSSSKQKLRQNQQGNLYMKKLINSNSMIKVKIFTLIWVLAMGTLQFFFYESVTRYSQLSQRIFRLQYNIQNLQIKSDAVWVLLNIFPYDNMDLIQKYQDQMYQSQSLFKSDIMQMASQKQLSQNFIRFYQDIWTQDCCKYIQNQLPWCRMILNGALSQGTDQIIAYLDRKYDYFMYLKLGEKDFRQKDVVKKLSDLELNYLSQIVRLNMNMLFKQHDNIVNVYERELFSYFIVTLLMLLLIIVIYRMLSEQNENMMKMQKLFKLIEFDSLQNMKQFKLYFKQNYYQQIFK